MYKSDGKKSKVAASMIFEALWLDDWEDGGNPQLYVLSSRVLNHFINLKMNSYLHAWYAAKTPTAAIVRNRNVSQRTVLLGLSSEHTS